MIPEDVKRSEEFHALLDKHGFTKRELGVAIIDLNDPEPKMFGYNMNHFIYPASVYKIFIGAEVLRRIECGDFSLAQEIAIKAPNDVDKDARIFPGDTRKLLYVGDVVTIDHLLDLMLTRSDNTASNMLIDLVGRENITEHIIHAHGWQGSEVTRKFLDRVKEDKPYQFSSTTLTCARHVAEFFYFVEKGKLVSPYVSAALKEFMFRWNRSGREGLFLPEYVSYYRKGGWLEINLYTKNIFSLAKALLMKGWAVIRWSNDAGVIKGEKSHYVISVFSMNKQINPWRKFRMKELAFLVYNFMKTKNSG